jgi:serine/threonine-protein kinase
MTRILEQRYELEAEIASGAAGTVWRARDLTTGTPVAVKLLHPSAAAQPDVVEAFREEARVLGELRHPGVVRAHEFLHTSDGTYALVMDMVAGRDLRRLLIADGPLAPAAAASVLAQVAAAISAVHAAGVVHGDVKPGNILVPEPPGTDGVRLVDFGVAQRMQRPVGATHATPEYVAPEVVAGHPPMPASDVYGIGIVAYEALSGRSPFRGGSVDEVLRRHHGWTVVQLPGVPKPLWDLINRCLELDPAGRPTAGELNVRLAELGPELVGLPPVALAPDSPTLQPRGDQEPTDGGFVSLDSLLGAAPAASSVAEPTAADSIPAGPIPVGPALVEPTPIEPARSGPVPVAAPAESAPWHADREPATGGNRARLALGVAAGVVLVALLAIGGWLLVGGGGQQPTPPAADPKHPSASTPARQHHRSASPPPSSPSATPGDGGTEDDGGDGAAPGGEQGGGADGGAGTDGGDGTGSGGTAGNPPGIGGPMPTMGAFGN